MTQRDPGEQPADRATAGIVDVGRVYPNAHVAHDSGQARLTISNACVHFGSLEVLREVNLTVRDREIVTIIGPSGCGKTTLLRSAAGLVRLTQGEVQIDGESVDRPLAGVTMVFQQFALFPWKTLWGNIAYGLRLRRLPKAEVGRRVEDAIRLVGLSGFERSYPYQLSGGMQQRAGLARALVMEPRLLLMDEPFSAVDAQTREQLQFELLRIWDARPTAMLFVTHAIEEAVLMGDRVVVLAGRPARVHEVFSIELPRPRDRAITGSDGFVRARNDVWRALVQGSGGLA